jgi:hypothetical protein
MRLDQLSIVLRPRTPWEAMDLGMALVRTHAAAIWKPWFALTLPAFVGCNLLAWWIGPPWLALYALRWLKPLFDRVPLYVLSRAVFGAVPGTVQTLRSPQVWANRQLFAWLTWRRIDPGRALKLPVDLLEGPRGGVRGQRVRVLHQRILAHSWGLTLAGVILELVVIGSVLALGLLLSLTTVEMLPENTREMADLFFADPPAWAQLVTNAVAYLAISLIEPFYVGAGFGLYLNRRTQLEAWDVELAFRRLAERAQALAAAALVALLLALPLALGAAPALAASGDATPRHVEAPVKPGKSADDGEDKADPPVAVRDVFGQHWRPHDEAFSRDVARAYRDPDLAPTRRVESWQLRDRKDAPPSRWRLPDWLLGVGEVVGGAIGLVGEYGLWLLFGVLVALLLWRLPAWLPWVHELVVRDEAPTPVLEHPDAVVERLPDDVPAAVRRLWGAGQPRAALALLYRASVERLAERLGRPLPPGATEAECLRRARSLPEQAARDAFAHVVRAWQGAAYGHRLPDDATLDALLAGWSRDFGRRA